MPQKCSICTHEKRQEIDQALINGDSFRYVSQRFSVSTADLHRHRHGGHIAEALAKAQNAHEVAAADSLLDQVRQADAVVTGYRGVEATGRAAYTNYREVFCTTLSLHWQFAITTLWFIHLFPLKCYLSVR